MNNEALGKVVFRTDASLQIGTGHVMRCLTLANALAQQGVTCSFICREHEGNLLAYIRECGFQAYGLPLFHTENSNSSLSDIPSLSHASWLGASWMDDAKQCLELLDGVAVDWMIVDHYALDARWEQALRSSCQRLMVIDDLADRQHDCDLLLDQNLGRTTIDYLNLIPGVSKALVGPSYALLRPAFSLMREQSLLRRKSAHLRRLLVTMGGIDNENATGQVLSALKECTLPEDSEVVVVMGGNAPWLSNVRAVAAELPYKAEVIVDSRDMAGLMVECDLAIGAAGGTSWERCCLGVPTLTMVLAENQKSAAQFLVQAGAAKILEQNSLFQLQVNNHLSEFLQRPALLQEMSMQAQLICDGRGAARVRDVLLAA